MTAKPSRPPTRRRTVGADDFRLIDGVNRIVENRLHGAGILTFRQLGELTPAYIADVLRPVGGITADKIKEQDWVGQAQDLAAQTGSDEDEVLDSKLRPQLTNEGFVVDLFLDENRQVQLTQVLHVKSDEGEAWYGWDESKLIEFLTRHAKAKTSVAPAESAPAVEIEDAESIPDGLELRAVDVLPREDGTGSGTIESSEPFAVRVTFGLNKLLKATARPLTYKAELQAVRKEDGTRIVVSQAAGRLDPSEEAVIISVPPNRLQTGLYTIRASLTVIRPGTVKDKALLGASSFPGGVLQVV
jgi:hypothetical protein